MRVSLLACVCAGVLALVGAPAFADVSDLQCKNGNSDATTGQCASAAVEFDPTINKYDPNQGASYEVDQLYLTANINTTAYPSQTDNVLNVHRILFAQGGGNGDGIGNSGRNVSTTIGASLPAGFLEFPFQMSYRADGFYLEPVTPQPVTQTRYEFAYKLKNSTFDQPSEVADMHSEVRLLYQPYGGFGFTASAPATVTSTYNLGTESFGLGDAQLPNYGVGTYFMVRRVVIAGNEPLTGNVAVTSGTTKQSVGGPNAPGNTYTVAAASGAFDAPVLSNFVTPAVDGAFVTFQLAPVDTAANNKVFISQRILTIKSVTPVDQSTQGVAFTGTYSLDVTGSTTPAASYVAGTQKLYVRPSGSGTWTQLSGSTFNSATNVVSYTLTASDVPAASAASLDLSVQADEPAPPAPSSSTASSSSSSTGADVPSSSSSSSSAAVSSTVASSTAAASSTVASSSSSTAAASSSSTATRSSSSSSSTGSRVVSSSSSSTGAAQSSSSSSGADEQSSSSTAPRFDGAAATVASSGVALLLAAVAALFA